MKILFVSSGNSGKVSPFVKQQADSISSTGITVELFLIKGKGILGYLKNYFSLKKAIKDSKPDLIHAHFWASAALSVLQRKVPVIVTFHGCDINKKSLRTISKTLIIPFVKASIYVSQKMKTLAGSKDGHVIACGVDLKLIEIVEKDKARELMKLDKSKKYVLFCSSFDREEKNYPLAKEVIDLLQDSNVELLELKNYSYSEVILLLNGVDLLLMTSIREGSPQIVKEALACNCPVISTDVGDVKDVISSINGCYISNFDSKEMSEKVKEVLRNGKRINGRNRISELGFDDQTIAETIIKVYKRSLL